MAEQKKFCIGKECLNVLCERHANHVEQQDIKTIKFQDYSKTCPDYMEPQYENDQEYFI